jgi:hypothetical protein
MRSSPEVKNEVVQFLLVRSDQNQIQTFRAISRAVAGSLEKAKVVVVIPQFYFVFTQNVKNQQI